MQKKLNLKNIELKTYCGSELFEVQDVSKEKTNGKIKNYDYPFNIKFKIRNDGDFYKNGKKTFKGSGIYLITYDDTIIYIGKYMPYNDGNVITDRWIKHIATMTNRGHRVCGFGKKNKKYEFLEKIGFLVEKGRMEGGDYSTSVKRLEFASKNWCTFKDEKIEIFRENVLPKFEFHYMQLNEFSKKKITELLGEKNPKIKEYYENLASLVETYLLWKYNPACNSNEGLNEINDKTVDEIKTEIKSFLEKLDLS